MGPMERRLTAAHAAFNGRDVPAALGTMHPDVVWPHGMENGHDGVRAYWPRQWGMIDPRVDPVGFTTRADGRVAVKVHRVVHDLAGSLMMDVCLDHVDRIEGGRIREMEIRAPVASPAGG